VARARSAVVVDGALEEGLRRMGATEADIARIRLERGTALAHDPNVYEVWPENWAVLQFFLRAQTQWLYAGGGLGPSVRVSMNYPGVESVARIHGVPFEQLQEWDEDLRVIELAVLRADSELALKRRNK